VKIREKDISLLCKITREIFMEQPVFLELEAPIKICGKLDNTRNLSYGLAILQFYRSRVFSTWFTLVMAQPSDKYSPSTSQAYSIRSWVPLTISMLILSLLSL
jgi:hypothetical protein